MSVQLTQDQSKIAQFLPSVRLGHGVGTESEPCTIAAINLALSGRLTDNIPECVSRPLGYWVIHIQDSMPLDMLRRDEWQRSIPLLAGSAGKGEAHRTIITNWLFETVLPHCQPIADELGIGAAWSKMCEERTDQAIGAVKKAAHSYCKTAIMETAEDYWADTIASDILTDCTCIDGRRAAIATADIASYISTMVCDAEEYWDVIDPPAQLAELVAA